MKRICCPNCGLQVDPVPQSLGDMPLEELVAAGDQVRQHQLTAALSGLQYRHSLSIAGSAPHVKD